MTAFGDSDRLKVKLERGRELCAQIDLKTDHRWLCHVWRHSSPHDHHGRAATSAQQLGSWCRRSGWGRRAQWLFEHQQLQQRNQSLAVRMQKAKVTRPAKALGRWQKWSTPQFWRYLVLGLEILNPDLRRLSPPI
jgi:hypothetical protein